MPETFPARPIEDQEDWYAQREIYDQFLEDLIESGRLSDITMAADIAAAIAATRGLYVGINAQTGTTYTPVLADRGKLVTLTNAAAITVTLPQNSAVAFPISTSIDFVGLGAGKPTFAAGTGATVVGTPSLVARAQYSAVSAIKISTNGWLIVGDLT